MPSYSHRFGKTTLGVGVRDYFQFHDEARDFADFSALYSRWLSGPVRINPSAPTDEQQADRALNWRVFGHAEPSLLDLAARGWYPNMHRGPLGLWDVKRFDWSGVPEELAMGDLDGAVRAGVFRPEELEERMLSDLWARNVVTDNGATSMLKNIFNSTGSAVSIMSHLVIAFGNRSYAVQSGSTINNASGAQTSIACAGGVQAVNMPNSASLTWSYGTTNAETWTAGSSAPGNLAATSITVVSQTVTAGLSHVAGDYIVTNPSTSDNPSSVSNSADSGALSAGAFTFSGTGAGNRQAQIQFTFSTSTTAGAYTEAYLSNAGTIASNSTANHIIFPPNTINSTTSFQLTVIEKI